MYHRHPPTRTLSVLLIILFAVSVSAQNTAQAVAVRPVVDEDFGQRITNPHRWIEDQKSEETSNWMKAQTDYARADFDRLTMREELAKDLTESSTAGILRQDQQDAELHAHSGRSADAFAARGKGDRRGRPWLWSQGRGGVRPYPNARSASPVEQRGRKCLCALRPFVTTAGFVHTVLASR
jgi:hypothetical protein